VHESPEQEAAEAEADMLADPPPVGPGSDPTPLDNGAEADWDDDAAAAPETEIEQWPPPRAREPIQPE
jgi:hypothetical protein